jgi:hypothetical protein
LPQVDGPRTLKCGSPTCWHLDPDNLQTMPRNRHTQEHILSTVIVAPSATPPSPQSAFCAACTSFPAGC